MRTRHNSSLAGLCLASVLATAALLGCKSERAPESLRVAIAPFQDMAMLTTYSDLKLDETYGTRLDLVTLAWEEIIPSLASSGPTVDVGFGSLIEFLTKYENINRGAADPLVYIFPTYVFKGGGFVSFNPDVPSLDGDAPPSPDQVKAFMAFRIGAQKNSMFDMMLFSLGRRAGIPRASLKITDTTMADGLLAAQAGSLDAAAAGLTQRNEALDRGGRVVLTMDRHGFADLTGLIGKRSTVERRRKEIEDLVKIWFDCVAFVSSDLDRNSLGPISWLSKSSSTQYTVATYKRALEAEYLPTSLESGYKAMVARDGEFSIARISEDVGNYLIDLGITNTKPPVPVPIAVTK